MTRRKTTLPRIIAGFTLFGMLAVLGYFIYLQFQQKTESINEGFRPLEEGFHSHGIDVSHYQGEINWNRLFKKSSVEISFVYCKATEGTSLVDKRWKENRKRLKSLNIPLGAYHFFKPDKDAGRQAHFFLKHYTPEQNDLPPVLDVEEEGTNAIELRNAVKLWLDIVQEKTGKRPIIYTNYYLFRNLFQPYFKSEHFWIANYSDRPERLSDERILYWQYTDQGKIPGIEGYVDLNMSKVKFEE